MPRLLLNLLVLFIAPIGCKHINDLPNDDMVYIECGDFIMGTPSKIIDSLANYYGFPRDYIASEFPPHKVNLSPFYIDKYEVTNEEFKDFIDHNPNWQKNNILDSLHNGKYLMHWENNTYPIGEEKYPIINISWYAAMEFCKWKNKRLPTEAEWEYVASNRGDNRIYPWGNSESDSSKANYMNFIGRAIEVGSYPPTELGVYDLAGNVWEYMLDNWSSDFYRKSPENNPSNGLKFYDRNELYMITSRRVIRGGSWSGADINLRISFRDSHPPEGAGNHVGCRCIREITTSNKK